MASVTAELRRAVEILAMPIGRLNQTVMEELAGNAALEVVSGQDGDATGDPQADAVASIEAGQWSIAVTRVRPNVRVRPDLPPDAPDTTKATWFCRFIDQRERMIARVLGAILRPGELPRSTKLSAAALSNELEIHESTLTRIAEGKTLLWGDERIPIVDLIGFDATVTAVTDDAQLDAPTQPLSDDRLDRVFVELERNGIVALQNAGATQTEGWEAADFAAKQRPAPPRGAVFYHQQDLQRAQRGGVLMLTFGAYEDQGSTDEASTAIAREVCETLARHGIEVSWDGSPRTRIQATLSRSSSRSTRV